MRSSTENRLLLTLAVTVLLVSYAFSRDTVSVEGELPKEDVAVIAKAVRGWSSPRFFNDITLRPQKDGSVWAILEESDGYKSLTVFTNDGSGWKGTRRLLLAEDKDCIVVDR